MKRTIVFLLAFILLLAGCGTNKDSGQSAPSTTSNDNTVTDNTDIDTFSKMIDNNNSLLPTQTEKTIAAQNKTLTLKDMSITIPAGWYYAEKPEVNALWLYSPNGATFSFVYNTNGIQYEIDDAVTFMHRLDDIAGYGYNEPDTSDCKIGNIDGKQMTFAYRIQGYFFAYAYLFAEYKGYTYTNFNNVTCLNGDPAEKDLSVYKTTVVPTIVFS